jgi:hypothetical protein
MRTLCLCIRLEPFAFVYDNFPTYVGKLSKQHLKARGGRGPKVQPWILWLFEKMHAKFDQLRKTDNLSSSFLLIMVMHNNI